MAWTEEQNAALQQIISDGKAKGLSNEEIQAQIDTKRQEFKALKQVEEQEPVEPVKTTTTDLDATVEEEKASDTESPLDDGSSELLDEEEFGKVSKSLGLAGKAISGAFNPIGNAINTAEELGIITDDFNPLEVVEEEISDFGDTLKLAFQVGKAINDSDVSGVGAADPFFSAVDKVARLSDVLVGTYESIDVDLRKGFYDTVSGAYLDLYQPDLTPNERLAYQDMFLEIGDAAPGGGFLEREKSYDEFQAATEDFKTTGGDYNNSIGENLYAGNFGVAADQTVQGIVEAAPSVAMAFMGPAGMVLLGASATGSAYEKLSEASPQDRGWSMYGTALLQGGVELASETITRGLAKGLIKSFKEPTEEAAKGLMRVIAGGAFWEGASEVAAQEFNGIIDYAFTDGKIDNFYNKNGEFDYNGVAKRVFDTFLISSLIGGGMSAGTGINNKNRRLRDERLTPAGMVAQNKKDATRMNELVTANRTMASPAVAQEIKKLKNKIENNKRLAGAIIQDMSKEDQIASARNVKVIADAKLSLKNDQTLTQNQRDIQNKLITEKTNENGRIFENSQKTWETTQKEKLAKNIVKQVQSISKVKDLDGRVLKDDKAIDTEYRERLEQLEQEGVNFSDGKTIDQRVDDLKKKKGENLQYYKKDGTLVQEFFVNQEKTLQQWDGTTGSHEILHGVLGRAIGTNPGDFKTGYKALRGYLEKNNSKLIKQIDSELGLKGYTTAAQYEEFFNAVSDKMVNGQVSYNKTLGDTLLQFFNRMMKPFTGDNTFTDGRQAFNFLQDFSKGQTKGNLSRAAEGYLKNKAIGEGGRAVDSKVLIQAGFDPAANKAKIDGLFKENIEGFNKGGEAKGKVAKDIAKNYMPLMKFYATRSQPKTGKSAFSTLDGFDMDTYLDFAQTELEIHIMNFDPTQNDSMDGWIMSQAYNKSLNALNDLGIDIDIDQSLLDEANAILSTDPEVDVLIDEKPQAPKRKRRNLIKDILNGKDLEPLVKTTIEQSFKDNIDLIGTNDFRPKMLESFNAKLGPELKKLLNTTPKFEDFIRTNFDYIYAALPQSVINKRYKEFAEQKLNEDGTPYRQTVDEVRGYNNMVKNGFIEGKLISDDKSGPPKFIKKKISKREFAEYFVGKAIAPSKRGTRKTSLLGSVAETLADDLTFKTLSDPSLIYKYQEGRQESVDNIINKIKKDFGRDVEQEAVSKSSLSLPAQINEVNNVLEYVKGKAYEGKNIKPLLKEYLKGKSQDEIKFLKPMFVNIEKLWNSSGLDVTIKELQAIRDIEGLVPDIEVTFDSYKDMDQFVAENKIEMPDLMTEDGELQFFGFAQDFSKTLDPKFVKLSMFVSSFGGGTTSMYSSKIKDRAKNKKKPAKGDFAGIPSQTIKDNFVLNNKINDFNGKDSKGNVIFNPKDAKEFSASTLNSVEKLIANANNPKTEKAQKELADKIKKFIKPSKVKAVQGARDYFYKKLNDYYQKAPNKTLAAANIARLFQMQSSLSSGIPRQGAVVTSVSLTPGYNKVVKGMFDLFQREHNIQNVNFNINTLKAITSNKFDKLYPLYSAKYTQTILDSDIQIALDLGMITEDLIKKYPDFELGDTGKTTFTEGFQIGMPSESMQILAGMPASSILDLNTGLTFDKVVYNKIAAKKAVDKLDAFVIKLKQEMFDQSKKAAENVFDPKNKDKIFKNPDNVQTFNEIITKSSKGENIEADMGWLSSKIDNNKNFVDLRKYNEALIKDSNQEVNPKNTTKQMLDQMADLDNQAMQARVKDSKGEKLDQDFNDIIENATGIRSEKRYGKSKGELAGKNKGRFDLLGIPPSAQDFVGLTRYFAGKGKKGDETIAWVKKNFLDPFARANVEISDASVSLANDFKGLKKILSISKKDLNKKIPGEPYTVAQAVRAYTWTKQGMKVPGLSKADLKELNEYVENDPNLINFSEQLININKENGYPKPEDSWLAGTIQTDLLTSLNTVVRAKYLKQWQENVDIVFNEANLNKLEASYGKGYRNALENILGRMKSGSNRAFKGDSLTGRFTDWINGAVGSIMFFNDKSAVLQTISSFNFINFTDNNPLKAAAAFANQPQYWGDVVKLINSNYLVQRRNGLKINVSEADIAEIAAESKNKGKAFINKVLKLGFLPTQIADSFAIASGGATFYRNRLNSYLKEGMSQKDAEAKAFQDFRETAEESQQSSRPDRISAQQAGPLGRIILAFANTPAQYARLMQKASSDLINRRGDDKTNLSKILYYGVVQNVAFNALQQALFALAFDDEEEGEDLARENLKEKKNIAIVNGMADSLLRGVGFHGAAISTLKNVIMKLASGGKAKDAAIEMLDISPPVSSKITKLRSAGRTWDWNKKEIMEKGWSLDNPAWLASGQVVSATTNFPLDRAIKKLQNLKEASDSDNEEWQRVATALGWAKWELDWISEENIQKERKKIFGSKSSKNKSKSKLNFNKLKFNKLKFNKLKL